METFSNLSIKSDDKDKLVKVVQNLSKFTSMYIKNINPSSNFQLLSYLLHLRVYLLCTIPNQYVE